jgi:hypothetical protein
MQQPSLRRSSVKHQDRWWDFFSAFVSLFRSFPPWFRPWPQAFCSHSCRILAFSVGALWYWWWFFLVGALFLILSNANLVLGIYNRCLWGLWRWWLWALIPKVFLCGFVDTKGNGSLVWWVLVEWMALVLVCACAGCNCAWRLEWMAVVAGFLDSATPHPESGTCQYILIVAIYWHFAIKKKTHCISYFLNIYQKNINYYLVIYTS